MTGDITAGSISLTSGSVVTCLASSAGGRLRSPNRA